MLAERRKKGVVWIARSVRGAAAFFDFGGKGGLRPCLWYLDIAAVDLLVVICTDVLCRHWR